MASSFGDFLCVGCRPLLRASDLRGCVVCVSTPHYRLCKSRVDQVRAEGVVAMLRGKAGHVHIAHLPGFVTLVTS